MKILIVDDEKLARERVINVLYKMDFPVEIKESSSGEEAIKNLNEFSPDLLFLDIDLKDMNGFEVLKNFKGKQKPVVVFITAHDAYALQAFDVEAFDFLLKPFKNERLKKTIEKVSEMSKGDANKHFKKRLDELYELFHNSTSTNNSFVGTTKLPIKIGNKTLLIETSAIQYISASGYYAEIYVEDNKYLIRESLFNLIEMLDPNIFFRVHRSTIINTNFIHEIIHCDYAQIDIRMKNKKIISVSKAQKKEFMKKIGLKS